MNSIYQSRKWFYIHFYLKINTYFRSKCTNVLLNHARFTSVLRKPPIRRWTISVAGSQRWWSFLTMNSVKKCFRLGAMARAVDPVTGEKIPYFMEVSIMTVLLKHPPLHSFGYLNTRAAENNRFHNSTTLFSEILRQGLHEKSQCKLCMRPSGRVHCEGRRMWVSQERMYLSYENHKFSFGITFPFALWKWERKLFRSNLQLDYV